MPNQINYIYKSRSAERVPSRLADTIYGSHKNELLSTCEKYWKTHFSIIFIFLGLVAGIILLFLKSFNVYQADPCFISLCLMVGFIVSASFYLFQAASSRKLKLLAYVIVSFIGAAVVYTITKCLPSLSQYIVLSVSAIIVVVVHIIIMIIENVCCKKNNRLELKGQRSV
jgi:riboflavin transporter FmnP